MLVLPLCHSCVLQCINYSYWPLLAVSWEGSTEKEALSAPLKKCSNYTKYSSELSLLSAWFNCLRSAFLPENHFAFCRGEKPGEMTGLALDNKEECQVWGALETHASFKSALRLPQRGMKFLGNRSEGQACKGKKQQQHAASFLRKRILSLFLLLLQKQPFLIPEINTTVFSVPPSFPKLCFHSLSSAAVLMGSWELGKVPSSFFLLLTTFPVPLSPQTHFWAECASIASVLFYLLFYLFSIDCVKSIWGLRYSSLILLYFLIPLLLLREEEVFTG